MEEVMITTIDNPYDPFEEFTQWDLFDKEKGYNTTSRLGRLVNLTDDMTQIEENEAVERAIDRLIELDFLDIYRKVKRKAANT